MYFQVNGKRVFATTGGKPFDSSQPCVIFLHGSGLDHSFWRSQSRFSAFRSYAVLVPDLPGHSRSEGPPLPSIETMADWLNDVVTALDLYRLSIVGHSQGCLIALEFASRYPDRIRSVSFIASGLVTPVNPALIDAAENRLEDAIEMMMSWGFGAAAHLQQGPIAGNSVLAAGRNAMRANAPGVLATDLKACDSYENGKLAAAKITAPSQVILGGQDRMAPRKAGLELAEHLPDAEVHVIENCGHMLPLEVPDDCRQLLKSFVFTHNPSSQA